MTSIVTGATPERLDIVKWFYIEADDDTDYDAAADVIARAMTYLDRSTPVAELDGQPPAALVRPGHRTGPCYAISMRCSGTSGCRRPTRLLNQVDERRHPRTSATVDQLLDLHFELATLEPTTRSTYIGYANKHTQPLIGGVKAGVLDALLGDRADLGRCERPYGRWKRPRSARAAREDRLEDDRNRACAEP